MTPQKLSAWGSGGKAHGGDFSRIYCGYQAPEFAIERPEINDGARLRQSLIGSVIVLDLLSFEYGLVCYQPRFDDSHMAPYGQPHRRPADPTTYVEAIRFPVLVPGGEILPWLISSKIGLNASKALYEKFSYCGEASRGMLPVYQVEPHKQLNLAGRPGDAFYTFVLKAIDWIERDPSLFGAVTVAPPVPILPAAVPPIALQAAPQPANDNGTYRPVAVQVELPVAPASNDLLAKYTRPATPGF